MTATWAFPLPINTPGLTDVYKRASIDQGVDIPAPAHTPLLAVGNGVIVGHGINGFGDWAPILKLDSGERVYYGHAGPGNMVKNGTRVKAGQVIGEIGAGIVGISTGPHLEIGFAGVTGAPARGQRGDTMKTRLDGAILNSTLNAKGIKATLSGGDPIGDAISGGAGVVAQVPGALAHDAGSLAGQGASAIAKGIVDALFGDASKQGPYIMLVLVAVVGGAALIYRGARRTTGADAQPVTT